MYEWLESGELRAAGNVTAADLRRQSNGLTEVAVWRDGGQSSASVRRAEWGEESRRGHQQDAAGACDAAAACGQPKAVGGVRAAFLRGLPVTQRG